MSTHWHISDGNYLYYMDETRQPEFYEFNEVTDLSKSF